MLKATSRTWLHPKRAMGWLVQNIGALLAKVLLRPAKVDEIRIAVFTRGDVARRSNQIADALQLISDAAPHRYRRLTRELAWVVAVPGADFRFLPAIQGCLIRAEWLDEVGVVDVALVLVHEATHARLWRRGFSYEPEERERIELLCLRAEAELLHRLGRDGDAERVIQRIDQRWWEL